MEENGTGQLPDTQPDEVQEKPKKKTEPKKKRKKKAAKKSKVSKVVKKVSKPEVPPLDKSKVLVVSNHHRRIGFFDETVEILTKGGYTNILLNDTASSNSTAHFVSEGKAGVMYTPSASYDQAMVALKDVVDEKINSHGFETILLIDNDCFIRDTDHLDEFLRAHLDGEYGVSTHVVDPLCMPEVKEGDIITPISVGVEKCSAAPGIVPSPHLENSLTLLSSKVWMESEKSTFDHSRKWYCGMAERGVKFGYHKTEYKSKYSHAGAGWFHIGNLMAYIYAIENKQWDKFHVDSDLDMSRLGFLAVCNVRYVDHWPAEFQHSITAALHTTSRDRALECWKELSKGTCMEGLE